MKLCRNIYILLVTLLGIFFIYVVIVERSPTTVVNRLFIVVEQNGEWEEFCIPALKNKRKIADVIRGKAIDNMTYTIEGNTAHVKIVCKSGETLFATLVKLGGEWKVQSVQCDFT
ncbi:MAG: nuclear transport factor 2 family protein [Planctomycetaceae bacterium]|jgi:hypothetical protein|nr:nuclear transport factor 2 family protein [Planctomycetaceae bacterium]